MRLTIIALLGIFIGSSIANASPCTTDWRTNHISQCIWDNHD
jgi:hypothetical protein